MTNKTTAEPPSASNRALAPEPRPDWPESWRVSHGYDELELYGSRRHLGYSYAYQTRKRHILELVAKVARPGDRIIDVAAAQGNFSIALAKLGYAVTWNDIRADLIDYVKQKYDSGGIEFRAGNVLGVATPQPYDVAVVTEVIEHVAHPDEFLRRVAELVRPGGAIVLTTPNGRYFRNPLPRFSDCHDFSRFEAAQFGPDAEDHIFLLHPDEIRTLADAADLEVLDLRLFANPLTAGYLKSEALLRVLPQPLVERLEAISGQLPAAVSERMNTGLAVLFRKRIT